MSQRAAVLSKAVIRAAETFPMLRDRLAHILGVSVPTISRLFAGNWQLESGRKDDERALLSVRVYRALDSIAGEDDVAIRQPGSAWPSRRTH